METSTRSRHALGRRLLRPVLPVFGLVLATAAGFSALPRVQPLEAQPTAPTFTKDVAPILYASCTSCHRPKGMAPFSLMDYDSVKYNADAIRDAVETNYMPPWHAEGPHGTFLNDRRLTAEEKSTIMRWVDGGAKFGDVKDMPPTPVYASAWEIGTPDAIVTMPNNFVVPAAGTVEYQYFEVPTNFTEDKWVQAMEIMPGAREVVHHVLVYAKVPPPPAGAAPAAPAAAATGAPAANTAQPLFVRKPQYDPPADPPRADKTNGPPRQLGALIGSTAPGTNVLEFPKGTAMRVRAGTVLTFQMHYTAHGHETKDRTSMGFKFADAAPEEEIRAAAFVNGAFTLPAGERDIAVPSELEVTRTIRIWGLLPHTHVRGSRWQYTLQKPDGTKEVVLDVPRYDFNWQTYYMFATPLEIPAGGKLMSMAWYDNSVMNRQNPDPKKDVTWGDQTWEEMQYTGFLFSIPRRP